MSELQRPSVGRIVHYVSYGTPGGEYGQQCRAAIITEVSEVEHDEDWVWVDAVVGLCVFNPTGQFFVRDLVYSDANAGGTWHWPERITLNWKPSHL